jgi:putative transposase
MSKKRHTPEQIMSKLREAEVLLSQGQSVPVVCKRIEVSEQNYGMSS